AREARFFRSAVQPIAEQSARRRKEKKLLVKVRSGRQAGGLLGNRLAKQKTEALDSLSSCTLRRLALVGTGGKAIRQGRRIHLRNADDSNDNESVADSPHLSCQLIGLPFGERSQSLGNEFFR